MYNLAPTIGIAGSNKNDIPGVRIAAIDVLFSDYPKCLDLIFIYLSGLMVSIRNLRLFKHPSFTDKWVKVARRVILTLSANPNIGSAKMKGSA